MTPAKLWLRIFFAGFVVVVAMLLVTLFTPVPYGDLSRIGRISDREFGWQRQPPPIPEATMKGVPVDQADVLVIGDSFSMTFMWQSELVRAGYKVATTYWGQYGETMCSDLNPWLAGAGFNGKLIIFESVERLLKNRLELSLRCETMHQPFSARVTPLVSVLHHTPGFELNSGATLTSGLITQYRTYKTVNDSSDTTLWSSTMVRRVPDGCAQFSNRHCSKALFFKEDLDNGDLDAQDFARLQQFNARHTSVPSIWMVVPDKTTTYITPNHSKAFMDAFRAAGLGPDLFSMTAENRMKVKDLYYPNDTHLSMHGQVVLGQRMLEAVRKVLPPPTGSAS